MHIGQKTMSTKILLVDDDDPFRLSIKNALELENYSVIEAIDGLEALTILENNNIDLIITDVIMPAMGGIEFSEKSKEIFPSLKILGITGGGWKGNVERIERLSKSYFTAFLKKPFGTDELLKEINHLLVPNSI